MFPYPAGYHFFQDPDFSGSGSRVRIQGPGPVSEVRVQGPGPGFRSSLIKSEVTLNTVDFFSKGINALFQGFIP